MNPKDSNSRPANRVALHISGFLDHLFPQEKQNWIKLVQFSPEHTPWCGAQWQPLYSCLQPAPAWSRQKQEPFLLWDPWTIHSPTGLFSRCYPTLFSNWEEIVHLWFMWLLPSKRGGPSDGPQWDGTLYAEFSPAETSVIVGVQPTVRGGAGIPALWDAHSPSTERSNLSAFHINNLRNNMGFQGGFETLLAAFHLVTGKLRNFTSLSHEFRLLLQGFFGTCLKELFSFKICLLSIDTVL